MNKKRIAIYGMIAGIMACGALIGSGKGADAAEADNTSGVPSIAGAEKVIYLDGKDKISVRGSHIISVKYASTKKKIATISKKGMVQPKKKGKTTIKATVVYRKETGGKKYTKKLSYRLKVLDKTKKYFTIQKEGSSYAIKGLTNKGKAQTTIYVPGYYKKVKISKIGPVAFMGNTKMKVLHLSDNIKWIEHWALDGCSNLEILYLGKDFEGYEDYHYDDNALMRGCISFRKFIVDSRNKYYKVEDDVLFDKSGTTLCSYPAKKSGAEYSIPVQTDYIDDYAFNGCLDLKNVIIPDRLSNCGNYCFADSGLTSITLPDGVKNLGYGAFSDCASLSKVQLSKGLSSIQAQTFANCISLKSITLSSGISKVSETAFMRCRQFTGFVVNNANKYFTSLDGVLYSKDKRRLHLYPVGRNEAEYEVNMGTDSIGEGAFYQCTALKKIILPASLKAIGNEAFLEAGLKEITLPDSVNSIGYSAFAKCMNLSDVSLPDNLTSLSQRVFDSCTNLRQITLPKEVSSVSVFAFAGCDNLERINVEEENTTFTSVDGVLYSKSLQTLYRYPIGKESAAFTVPKTVKEIKGYAFSETRWLKKISATSNEISFSQNAFTFCSSLEGIQLSDKLSDDTQLSFEGCTSLKKIKIPSGMKRLCRGAFKDCISLEKVVIPNKIVSIGPAAFYNCSKLKEVTVGSNVKYIKDSAFSFCKSLKKVTIKSKRLTANTMGMMVFSGAGKDNYKKLVIKVPAGKKKLYQKIFRKSALSKKAKVK